MTKNGGEVKKNASNTQHIHFLFMSFNYYLIKGGRK